MIGRIVESGGASAFESPPLCVPPDVAEAVAASPRDWLTAVAEGCRGPLGPVLAEFVARMHQFVLLCDVPCHLRRQLIQPEDPALRADQLGSGGNGLEYDTALVLAALAGELDIEGEGAPAGAVRGAALLEPDTAEALETMLLPSDAAAVNWLGGVLAPPAGVLCARLAAELSDAA